MKVAFPPRDSISLASVANSSSRRAARTTLVPRAAKASAVARPIPLLAPVIRATLPFMSDIRDLACAAWRKSGNVATTRGRDGHVLFLRCKKVIVAKWATSHELADRRQEDRISRKPITARGCVVGHQDVVQKPALSGTSSKLLILRKAPAMDPQDAGRKLVGDAEPGHQRHCWWLRNYPSAPSPDSDQSERATCILLYSDRPA